MEIFFSVCLGLGLAAACGFRVFVPFLIVNLAARADYLAISGSFDWLSSTPALIAFAVATALEIGAYYVPWLDNLLDSVASPAAVVSGVLVSASVITGMDPFLKWTLAVIAGGGIAGAVQALTVGTRGASTLGTGGLGNPVVASAELGFSALLSILSVAMPVLGLMAVLVVLAVVGRRWRRRRRVAA